MMEVLPVNDLGVIGFSQLAKVFPLPLAESALESFDRRTFRLRELPREMMFYFPMMAALGGDDSAAETLRRILEGQESVFGRRTEKVTGPAGISKARISVGFEPLKLAFDQIAKPLSKPGDKNGSFCGLLVVALDATLVNVPDTEQNAAFGRPSNQHERTTAYPQTRILAAVECGSHATFGASVGTYNDSELTLAKQVISCLDDRMLVIADRLFFGWELFNAVMNTGAKIVWRLKTVDRNKLKLGRRLEDGSYEAEYIMPESFGKRTHLPSKTERPSIPVRVLTYAVAGAKDEIHLITTMTNHEEAPAAKLAELYLTRWEIELVFKEMKVELNKNRAALRSGTPNLILQEVYGLLMAHYAVRSLMYEAASRANVDPRMLSFRGAVKTINRKSLSSGDFSP
jgi:IS4 transposase